MTIMIPSNCVDVCPIAQVLYKNLKIQLGSTDRVVQYLVPKVDLSGSLFWVQHRRQSLFIYLLNSVENSVNLDSIERDNVDFEGLLKNKEVSQLLALQQQLLPSALCSHRSKLAPFLIINPYAGNKPNSHLALKSLGLYFSGKELIKSNTLGKLVYQLLGMTGSDLLYQYMRHVFNPELIISKNMIDSVNDAGDASFVSLKESLLDENQEKGLKENIVLHSHDYRSDSYNLMGVTGCVASGKTETLFQRAKLIKQLEPDSRVLIITANSASQARLRERDGFVNSDKPVEIFSFNEWSKQQLKPSEHLASHSELVNTIEARLKKNLEEENISQFVFLCELDFIYGRKIYYENDYLSTQNMARTYPLNPAQFSQIWRSVLLLKNEFSQKNWLLPARIPQLLWDRLEEQLLTIDYDHILVDDAHLLPPIAFEIFKKVLKPESGQIFVTQNINQEILNPSLLWKEAKLDLRGRNTRLLNSYHINPQIINASNAFFLNRFPDACDQIAMQDIKDSEEALLPRLLHFHSEADEQNRLLNEVKQLLHSGCDPQKILIISNDGEIARLSRLIAETLKVSVDCLNDFYFKSHRQRTGLGICNYLEAQGLNASFVFVFGLKQLFEREKKAEKVVAIHQSRYIENTRLITMAMTRARKELTLFITTKEIPQAFITPYIRIPTNINKNNEELVSVVSYLCKSG